MSKASSFYAEGFCKVKEVFTFYPALQLPALPGAMHVK